MIETKALTPEEIAALPEDLRQHMAAVNEVGIDITELVNDLKQPTAVVLDALINLYVLIVVAEGMQGRAGPFLARLGMQWSIEAGRVEVVPPPGQRH